MNAPEYRDKPRGSLRGLMNTAAEISIALRDLGESDEVIRRVVRGMALAALGPTARPAIPAEAPYGWREGRYVILETQEQQGDP